MAEITQLAWDEMISVLARKKVECQRMQVVVIAASDLVHRFNDTRGVTMADGEVVPACEDANIFAEWDTLDDALNALDGDRI